MVSLQRTSFFRLFGGSCLSLRGVLYFWEQAICCWSIVGRLQLPYQEVESDIPLASQPLNRAFRERNMKRRRIIQVASLRTVRCNQNFEILACKKRAWSSRELKSLLAGITRFHSRQVEDVIPCFLSKNISVWSYLVITYAFLHILAF